MNKLRTVLARIDTGHLSKLWIFYRDYFKSDEACLDFIFDVVHNEPLSTTWQQDVDESLFIPRRMMNCVERMVSTASDMELIRKGKDIFKIVLLVSCVETLQTLAGNKSMSKKEMLFNFWGNYTSKQDKAYIRKNFGRDIAADGDIDKGIDPSNDGQEDSFWQFISVLNEYRNGASHEGEYWDICFKNDNRRTPISLYATVWLSNEEQQLAQKQAKHKQEKNSEDHEQKRLQKTKHTFSSKISYRKFEKIFVYTCINFIKVYVRDRGKKENADTHMDWQGQSNQPPSGSAVSGTGTAGQL